MMKQLFQGADSNAAALFPAPSTQELKEECHVCLMHQLSLQEHRHGPSKEIKSTQQAHALSTAGTLQGSGRNPWVCHSCLAQEKHLGIGMAVTVPGAW